MKKSFLAGALALSLFGASCLGPDNARNQVLHWNRTVTENKWANEGIFIVCLIVPVYALAWLGDIVIFNSFEFWGAENPIKPPPPMSH